jgi:hypothetical protein
MFFLHQSFKGSINGALEWARWILLLVFLLVTFQLFITIIAPRFIQYTKIRFFYRNHIIICGLNAISMELIRRLSGANIVVIAAENDQYTESLKQRKVKLILGDPTDAYILQTARVDKASRLYAVTDADSKNVEIAHAAYSILTNIQRSTTLICFTLVNDLELKKILEDTVLFKYKTGCFEGSLFNINEMGIKYGVCMNIDKILPATMTDSLKLLLIGLTEKTENVLLNLAHCLTMERKVFKFTIVEKDEAIIASFRKKYHYLWNFVEIEFANDYLENICTDNRFDSICVCIENQLELLKQAIEIRCFFGKSAPNIFLFCNGFDTFNTVFKEDLEKKKIFSINLFEQIADYIFELNNHIETNAQEVHYFWNIIYKSDMEWSALSGHFKQSNRNQILDIYLKTYIALSEKYEEISHRLISFSDKEKETLAMMEHNRWMIEKYVNGWTYGERDNECKKHDCLEKWEKLSKEQQAKDYDAVNLMINLLNKHC